MVTELSHTTSTEDSVILFVDDEPALRRSMELYLKNKGFEVLLAETGEQAVDVYEKNSEKIKLVISDHGLPGLSGSEAYLVIKKTHPDVKFILASGFLDIADQKNMLKQGVLEFIQKPFELPSVLSSIHAALKP